MTDVQVDPSRQPVPEDVRTRARAELLWYLRHADALARWPVLQEAWAEAIEARRLRPRDAGGEGPISP
jgi:hypothetical protein